MTFLLPSQRAIREDYVGTSKESGSWRRTGWRGMYVLLSNICERSRRTHYWPRGKNRKFQSYSPRVMTRKNFYFWKDQRHWEMGWVGWWKTQGPAAGAWKLCWSEQGWGFQDLFWLEDSVALRFWVLFSEKQHCPINPVLPYLVSKILRPAAQAEHKHNCTLVGSERTCDLKWPNQSFYPQRVFFFL